jgi:hypothetical protein
MHSSGALRRGIADLRLKLFSCLKIEAAGGGAPGRAG